MLAIQIARRQHGRRRIRLAHRIAGARCENVTETVPSLPDRWLQTGYTPQLANQNGHDTVARMSGIYLGMNAWREILARVFEGFSEQPNVSPEWLVNPATRRRLKLDVYYPEADFAVRFVGLTAKGQRRQSDGEALESQQRDQTRVELCRLNGVQLALIDINGEPVKQMDGLLRVITRASRVLGDSDLPAKTRNARRSALLDAHVRAEALRGLIRKQPEQMMANLAEAWRDREANLAGDGSPAEAGAPAGAAASVALADLAAGQRVRHTRFGDGVITDIESNGDDPTIAILFDAATERTFLASLVQDKLELLN